MIRKYTITDDEFNKLRKLVFDIAGITLAESKRELVISRFSRRLRALDLSTFSDYYNFIITDGSGEIQNFINSITTNKTDFFRENHHFEFIINSFIPEVVAKKQESVKVWSAGCSTGEEPYTIAMVLHNYLVEKHGIKAKILATDIDTNVLSFASKGIYREEVMDPVDGNLLSKYFLRGKDNSSGFYKAKEVIKDMITFRQLNFIAEEFPIKTHFDIIFCRNVIIYFNNETKSYVLNKLNSYIKPGGYFIIGHSEAIFDMVEGLKYLKNTIYNKSTGA